MQIINYIMQGSYLNAMLQAVVYALILIVLIPIQEFSRAFVAYKLGDDSQKWMGRLTLNPMKHLDPMGSLFIVMFGFGWGRPVQINSRSFKNFRSGMILTAAAGPIANIIVAFAAILISRITMMFIEISTFLYIVTLVFSMMASLSISLAFFNLIPLPPLDGSKIFGMILPTKFMYYIERYSLYFMIGLIALLRFTVVGDWFSWLVYSIESGMFWVVDSLFNLIGLTL